MSVIVTADDGNRYIVRSTDMEWRARTDLVAELRRVVGDGKLAGVVLDLDGVTYINSAGLGAIFVLRKFAMEAGAKLVLARPTAAIRRLLDTANIPTLIPVTDDLDEARRVLAGDNEVKEVRN